MRTRRLAGALAWSALLLSGTATAEWTDIPISFFGPGSAKVVGKSVSGYAIEEQEGLEIENAKGIITDLNGDKKPELILEIDLCGTGGCPFQIYDGATRKRIGELSGGTVWVFGRKVNGWPILQTYSPASATSGAFQCLVFENGQYSVVSHVDLYDKSVEELFNRYKSAKELKW